VNFDLAVIGGGLAGLVAAARAAELGLRVVVLERGVDELYACNSRYSGGIFHVSYHDPAIDPAALREAMKAAMRGLAEPELVEAIASDARRALDWLRAQGARFIRGTISWHAWVLAPPRPFTTGMVWEGRGPDVLLRTLSGRIAERNGRVLRGTRARSLILEDGKCCGVVASQGGKEIAIHAAAIVIADGGFQGNAELFRKHIGPRPDLVLQRGAGTGVGDGLSMALDAGAAVSALNRFYGHLLSRDALRNDKLWPYPQIDAVAAAAIVVDRGGKRFLDERMGGIYISNELARLEDPTCATVVCDAPTWERAGREALIPPNPLLEKSGGTLHRADTLAALAKLAALPGDALEETVTSYNASLTGSSKGQPIRQAPFYAIPVCAGITNTMGGIAIDGHGGVRHKNGDTIPGLYAAGTTTGGLEGGPHAGYVGGLIKAAVFGLRAAEHAAQSYRATSSSSCS
jgi:fumarate reductase flavoprotein subunit